MLEDYQNKVCVVTGAASGIGKALCEKLVALGAQVYALDRNKADIEGLSAFVETDLSDKGSIDAAFCVLPQVIDRFFGVAGLSGARTSYWLTFTVNFIANKYMTDGSSAIPGNFASKLGGALGAWITGVLLSLAGYISAEGVTEQPAGALMMIRIDFAIVPAILVLIIGLCCLAFSKLEKQAAEFEAEKKAKETPLTEDA